MSSIHYFTCQDDNTGSAITRFSILSLRQLHQHLGSRVQHLHLFQDGGSIIGDGNLSFSILNHLIHAPWAQRCLDGISDSCIMTDMPSPTHFYHNIVSEYEAVQHASCQRCAEQVCHESPQTPAHAPCTNPAPLYTHTHGKHLNQKLTDTSNEDHQYESNNDLTTPRNREELLTS
ncbi:hypothetical protein E2C01_038642 [Portunus trituberculatus]|uniref:Uncharacterized protein n=1 Tax=Portunus trituberculatus TaxID=210409 RepID=A0A5B7FBC0_PORTR|nr:hypothetical protein [Portunus trituberculatus]